MPLPPLPPSIARAYDYSAFQALNPSTPLPADRHETDYDALFAWTGVARSWMATLQLADAMTIAANMNTAITSATNAATSATNAANSASAAATSATNAEASATAAAASMARTFVGGSPPASPTAGAFWTNNTSPSSTRWTVSMFDGTDWISLGILDTTTNIFEPANTLLRNGTTAMLAALPMGGFKITNLGAPTPGSAEASTALYAETVANAAPAAKIQVLNSTGFAGSTDLGTGSGNAIAFTACDILLPDNVEDIFVVGTFIMDQTAAASNTAQVFIRHLDSSLATIADFGTGSSYVTGANNRTISSAIRGARVQASNIAGSRLRFFAFKDIANGPFNLINMHTSAIVTVR